MISLNESNLKKIIFSVINEVLNKDKIKPIDPDSPPMWQSWFYDEHYIYDKHYNVKAEIPSYNGINPYVLIFGGDGDNALEIYYKNGIINRIYDISCMAYNKQDRIRWGYRPVEDDDIEWLYTWDYQKIAPIPESDYPSNSKNRPKNKTIRVFGKAYSVAYYHDGVIMNIREIE